MFVKLMSFYFMNSIAVFSVMFSHILAEEINFCCNFRNVTYILKLNVSLVSPCISCNAETRIYGLVCMFAHIMPFRNINLRRLDWLCRTQFYFFLEYLNLSATCYTPFTAVGCRLFDFWVVGH